MDNDPRQNIPGKKGDCHNGTWVGICTVVKSLSECGRPEFNPWIGKIPQRRERLPTPVLWPGEFQGHRVRHDWATFAFTFNHLTDLHQHRDIKASRNGDREPSRDQAGCACRTVTRKREVKGTGQWVWEDWKACFKNLSCLWLREIVWYSL